MKKELKDLNLLDRFLFAEAIEDVEVMELMLEIILGKEVVLKHLPQAEKEIRRNLLSKMVRLDVLSIDTDDAVYNTEVQQQNTGALPKRARYYQGMIDSKLLQSGAMEYSELNDVYIIIITPFDLFGEGLFCYEFSMMCENHTDLKLEDGAKRIFLNTHGIVEENVSQELIDLLRYIEHSDAATAEKSSSLRVKQIHQKVEAIKFSEEVGIRFMNAWEEKMLERQEGAKEGAREKAIEIAKNFKSSGIEIELIAKNTGLTIEEIEKL